MEELKKRQRHGKYVKTVKLRAHDIEIKVNPSQKLKALRIHNSQMDAKDPLAKFPEKTRKQVLTREYYSLQKRRVH